LLKPLWGAVKHYRIVSFDTEDDSKGHVLQLCFAWKDDSGKTCFFDTTDPDEAIKWIYEQPTSVFVAHNLEYDLNNLLRHCNYKYVKQIFYTNHIVRASFKNIQHTFFDSFNWFAKSLAKMGDVVGLKKLDMDLDDIIYVHRDAEILLEFVTMFQEKLNTEYQCGLAATIGSISMQTYRRNYLREKIKPYNNPKCLNAYYGGRCELFYRGEIAGPINVIDVNSMYMYTMLNDYPDTSTIEEGNYKELNFGYGQFEVECPESMFVPVLPQRNEEGRLTFPTGHFIGWWTFHEVRYAEKCGYKIIRQLEGHGTNKGKKYFFEFDTEIYRKRLESASLFNKTVNKSIGVNLYGKFVQHKPQTLARTEMMSEEEMQETGARMTHAIGPFFFYEIPLKEPPPTANYLWGIYVTSYARIHLHKAMICVHQSGGTLLYSDTDSIFYCGRKKVPGIDYDETKLGAFKAEYYVYGNFLISKGYILRDKKGEYKIACKGVPMPKWLSDPEKKHLKGSRKNPQIQFLLDGETEVTKPYRMREALIQHQTPGFWHPAKKTNANVYERRTGKIGPTKPVHLELF
jgi:hypothetical protein